MTDDTTKRGEDFEVTEDHPDERYDEERRGSRVETHRATRGREHEWTEDDEVTEEHPQRRDDDGLSRARRKHRKSRERADTGAKVSAGGSTIGAVAGAGGMVLAILGLIGLAPFTMLAIATIAVGAGMFLSGLTISASISQAIEEAGGDAAAYQSVGGGLSTEVVGGATGIVLGILALFGTSPMVLIPAAIIALGAADFFGAGATSQLQKLSMQRRGRRRHPGVSQSLAGISGTKAFIGIGVSALGIIALAGMAPMTLSLIAFVALGTSMLVSGAAVGGQMVQASSV